MFDVYAESKSGSWKLIRLGSEVVSKIIFFPDIGNFFVRIYKNFPIDRPECVNGHSCNKRQHF